MNKAAVREILGRFGSTAEVSRELGMNRPDHLRGMIHRGSIPKAYWAQLVEAGRKRGVELTLEELALAHEKKRQPRIH